MKADTCIKVEGENNEMRYDKIKLKIGFGNEHKISLSPCPICSPKS
jgi:hypothetical protein